MASDVNKAKAKKYKAKDFWSQGQGHNIWPLGQALASLQVSK